MNDYEPCMNEHKPSRLENAVLIGATIAVVGAAAAVSLFKIAETAAYKGFKRLYESPNPSDSQRKRIIY